MMMKIERCCYATSAVGWTVWAAHFYLNRPHYELGATAAFACIAFFAGIGLTIARTTP